MRSARRRSGALHISGNQLREHCIGCVLASYKHDKLQVQRVWNSPVSTNTMLASGVSRVKTITPQLNMPLSRLECPGRHRTLRRPRHVAAATEAHRERFPRQRVGLHREKVRATVRSGRPTCFKNGCWVVLFLSSCGTLSSLVCVPDSERLCIQSNARKISLLYPLRGRFPAAEALKAGFLSTVLDDK